MSRDVSEQSNTRNAVLVEDKELDLTALQETVFDLIRDIRDPEKEDTLEELKVLYEDGVQVEKLATGQYLVHIEFTPTVPHCSLASLIGLSVRAKLQQCLPEKHKVDIVVKDGSHSTADEINKQINDKERIAAAMENPNLQELIMKCIEDRADT